MDTLGESEPTNGIVIFSCSGKDKDTKGLKIMGKDDKKQFSDFSNVRNQKNYLIPEEFPEGAFGSSINKEEPVESKSTPWEDGQRRQSAFVYPYKELHEDLPRQIDGAHPLHDHPDDVNPEQEE